MRFTKTERLTPDEVARHIGVPAQAVSKRENGTPDTVLLPKIADYSEVFIDSLFRNKDTTLFNRIQHTEFFKFLSDQEFWATSVFLNKREHSKSFTPKWLEKHLHISEKKVLSIISVLKSMV